ncbi:MAG TPA: xanthine dehydrogenase family protein subunit M [Thermodesulfobacteriota bacterium]|nr:xanthine dehydrogenase family protein subunit M [Thermodesulfobacteriota bacterium]
MIPGPFQYFSPTTLDEAVALLARYGEDAKVLSGGQSLIPMLKLRLASPKHVIDINRIPGLAYIREADGWLRIGALAREADLEQSDDIRRRYPLLFDTASVVADPLVRNLATVCGNIAHADPANDHPATMLALEAEVVAVGPRGERRLPVVGFFTAPYTTLLKPDEILTELRVPVPPARSGGAYLKLERKVGDFATAAVAVQLTLDASGVCRKAGIGLTNVGPTPIKAVRTEAFLTGKRLDEPTIREAGRIAAEEAQPRADHRGSVEYKRDLVRIFTMRGIRRAVARAEGREERHEVKAA